jgi:hypothetical protein
MSARAIIGRVTDVQPNPNSDHLDIVSIGGYTNVANREADNVPRYQVGDFAVMLGDNLILPEWLLKHMDLWNEEKNKGYLAGSKGNRTKSRNVAGIESNVALCKIDWECLSDTHPYPNLDGFAVEHLRVALSGLDFACIYVRVTKLGTPCKTPEGFDMSLMLDIQDYNPA